MANVMEKLILQNSVSPDSILRNEKQWNPEKCGWGISSSMDVFNKVKFSPLEEIGIIRQREYESNIELNYILEVEVKDYKEKIKENLDKIKLKGIEVIRSQEELNSKNQQINIEAEIGSVCLGKADVARNDFKLLECQLKEINQEWKSKYQLITRDRDERERSLFRELQEMTISNEREVIDLKNFIQKEKSKVELLERMKKSRAISSNCVNDPATKEKSNHEAGKYSTLPFVGDKSNSVCASNKFEINKEHKNSTFMINNNSECGRYSEPTEHLKINKLDDVKDIHQSLRSHLHQQKATFITYQSTIDTQSCVSILEFDSEFSYLK